MRRRWIVRLYPRPGRRVRIDLLSGIAYRWGRGVNGRTVVTIRLPPGTLGAGGAAAPWNWARYTALPARADTRSPVGSRGPNIDRSSFA